MRDDLPHAMRETARKLEPDVVRLAAGGVSRGTRMRRAERAVQVLGSVLAVAVVFAGVVLFGPHHTSGNGGSGGAANEPAAPGVGSSSGTASPGTPNTPGNAFATATAPTTAATTPSFTGAPQITAAELDGTLKSCLSGAGVTGRDYVAVPAEITVSAQLADGGNVGFLAIAIAGPGGALPGRGTPQVLGDQSVVYVSTGPGTSDGRHVDKTELTVTLVRTDGTSLTALETNSPSEKSAAAPGAPLLLAAKQVIVMLDSSAWDGAAAAATASTDVARTNAGQQNAGQPNAPWPAGSPSSTLAPQDILMRASPGRR